MRLAIGICAPAALMLLAVLSAEATEAPPAPASDEAQSAESQAPTAETPKAAEPFAFADFSWIPGNYAASERPLATKAFTGEFRVDVPYHYSFNRPQDNTISGSSEVFRHN